jgi:hypothetical protein
MVLLIFGLFAALLIKEIVWGRKRNKGTSNPLSQPVALQAGPAPINISSQVPDFDMEKLAQMKETFLAAEIYTPAAKTPLMHPETAAELDYLALKGTPGLSVVKRKLNQENQLNTVEVWTMKKMFPKAERSGVMFMGREVWTDVNHKPDCLTMVNLEPLMRMSFSVPVRQ